MVYFSLIFLVVSFFFFAIFSRQLSKVIGRKICAICFAVSSTWLLLLILRHLDYSIDPLLLAILMGQSVIGVSYTIQDRFSGFEYLWLVRVGLIVFGTYFIYSFLTNDNVLSFIFILFILALGFFSLPSIEFAATELKKKEKKALEQLQERLKDCC